MIFLIEIFLSRFSFYEEEQNNNSNNAAADKTPDVEYRYNNLAGSQNNILNNNIASSPITRKTIAMKPNNAFKYDKNGGSRPNGYNWFF